MSVERFFVTVHLYSKAPTPCQGFKPGQGYLGNVPIPYSEGQEVGELLQFLIIIGVNENGKQ